MYACDFADLASDYLAADLLKVYTSGTISSIGTSDVDGGTLVNPTSLKKAALNASAARIVGLRYKRTGTPSGTVNLLAFYSGAQLMGALRINASGQLQMIDGNLTQIGIDTGTPLSASTYYVLEVGYLISDTVGRVEVKVNGSQIAALTSIALGGSVSNTLDTKPASQTTIDTVEISGGVANEVDWIWTQWDTVVWTSAEWLGTVRKITLRPKAGTAGDGFYNTGTGWAVGAGSTTISDVIRDTSGMDSDTSYAVRVTASGTDADRFSVKCAAMPSNTNVVKLAFHRAFVRNTSGSSSTHKRFVYAATGGTTHDSGVTVTDNTTYGSGTPGGTVTSGDKIQDNFLVHPNGSALTKTLIDNMQIGVRTVTLT